MKRACLLSVLMLSVFLVCSANALTYQDGSDVQFTFNSTLSISISDADIVIGNLIPGQDDTSNAVDVVVNTNNLYGYTLTATVGDATKDYRDLRHTNGTTNIASIDVNSDLSTLSGQSSSVWGYTVSTNGTTWSNYNGLPKYDDTTNTAELRATDGAAADSTTSFKIGAYAEEGQLAGDYTNVINFKVVTNIAKIYMQDVTASMCPADERLLVYDRRDEKPYYIQKIDNTCWMTSNIGIAGNTALYSDTSNVPDGYPAAGGIPYYTLPASSSMGLNNPSVANLYNFGDVGSFYNYAAATVGTNPSSGNSEYDLCPKRWRLPTSDELSSLVTLYHNRIGLMSAPFYGTDQGLYYNGSWSASGCGYYRSSTSGGSTQARYLYYCSDSQGINNFDKAYGYPVRCVLK